MKKWAATVERLIDGDTLTLRVRARLRESAPEIGAPGGAEALERLRDRFPFGQPVEVEVVGVDAYARPVIVVDRLTGTDG